MIPWTLVMAYYDNPGMLTHHIHAWRELPHNMRESLRVIIVDDASPRWRAENVVRDMGEHGLRSLELYCMEKDVPWNQDACRNIGAYHAREGWLLLTDMDHVVPRETWARLMTRALDERDVAISPSGPHSPSISQRARPGGFEMMDEIASPTRR